MTTNHHCLPDDPRLAAFPPDDALFTLSASRLEKMGGKFGDDGCERKYTGEYCFDMRQSGSEATEKGSAFHLAAEIFQATGQVINPESELGALLQSGMHLINACGHLLVEHEHVGLLPNGVAFVAYLDGHSEDGGTCNTVVAQDLKTTSDPKWALTSETLPRNVQSMLYAWILSCLPHWFCPPLPSEEHYGPKHWQWWDPAERGAKSIRLRWLYFLTRGNPRAWEVPAFVTAAQAEVYLQEVIIPLSEKMSAAHTWRKVHPEGVLADVDRNLEACRSPRGGYGRWCGVGERQACEYGEIGTPLLQLAAGKKRPQLTAQERLAALKSNAPPAPPAPTTEKENTTMSQFNNDAAAKAQARIAALQARRAAGPTPMTAAAQPAPEAAAGSPPAPPPETPAGAPATPGTAAPATTQVEDGPAPSAVDSTTSAEATPAPATEAKKGPGRPRGSRKSATPPPTETLGAGINPPEVTEALAAIAQDPLHGSAGAIPVTPYTSVERDPLQVAQLLASLLPAGISMTVQGVAK